MKPTTPMARLKAPPRPLRPLREALRMGKSSWNVATFSDDLWLWYDRS